MNQKKINIYSYYKKLKAIKKNKDKKTKEDKERKQKEIASQKYRQAFKEWLTNGDFSIPKPNLADF